MRILPPFVLMLTLLVTACTAKDVDASLYFTDDGGDTVSLQQIPARVAVPQSSFAHMWQLAGGEVYATSEETFQEGIVRLTEDTVDLGSVKTPAMEAMLACEVDFVILSANIAGHEDIGWALRAGDVPVAFFDVETFDDYLRVLKIFTNITGRDDLYEQNGKAVEAQVQSAIAKKEGHPAPTVLLLRAYSSGVRAKASDNMTGAMLNDLGCINLADSDRSLLEDLSLEVILEKDPDYIFVTTMGESSEALDAMDDLLLSNPAWGSLTAVREGRYHVLPKDLFHIKPNDRWGEAYEMLAEILYGE